MRILFMPQAGALGIGGLTRCLAVAAEAALWGHTVAFFCRPSHASMVRAIDAEIFEAPTPGPAQPSAAPNYRTADSIRIRRMDELAFVERSVQAELDAYERFRPDVVFTENQWTATISSGIAGLALVSTAAWINHREFRSPLYDEAHGTKGVERSFNTVLRRYGLQPIADVNELTNLRSALNLAPVIPELEPRTGEFPNCHYVGHLLYPGIELGPLPDELGSDDDRQLIYVYMSVGTLPAERYVRELVDAFTGSCYRVAVALRTDTFENGPLPAQIGQVLLYRFLPGSTLAQRSAAVVTRGGLNTLMSCMLAGTPVIGFPGDSAEADDNMRSLTRFGAGMQCETDEFRASRLREIVEELVGDSRYRERAMALGDRLRCFGGPHDAVKLMERLVTTGC